MFKDDYILRMIEEMGDIIRKLLSYEEAGDFKPAHAEIDSALKKLGVSENLVRTMPTDTLINFVKKPGQNNAKRLLMLSRLISLDANVFKNEGDKFTANDFYVTSLEVLDQTKDEVDDDEDIKSVEQDIESIRFYISENNK